MASCFLHQARQDQQASPSILRSGRIRYLSLKSTEKQTSSRSFFTPALLRTTRAAALCGSTGFRRQSKDIALSASLRSALFHQRSAAASPFAQLCQDKKCLESLVSFSSGFRIRRRPLLGPFSPCLCFGRPALLRFAEARGSGSNPRILRSQPHCVRCCFGQHGAVTPSLPFACKFSFLKDLTFYLQASLSLARTNQAPKLLSPFHPVFVCAPHAAQLSKSQPCTAPTPCLPYQGRWREAPKGFLVSPSLAILRKRRTAPCHSIIFPTMGV